MSKVADWSRAVAQNLVAWVLSLVVGALALKLASLTPVIASYAPLSYLLTILVSVVLTLIAANLLAMLWQRFSAQAMPQVASEKGQYAQRSDEFEKRLAAAEEAAKQKPNLAILNVLNEERFKELDGELQGARASITKLGNLNNENLEWTRRQVASLYDALAAVYHRERLQELERHIEAGAKELAAPTERKACYTAEEWEEWEAKERAWRSALQAWCDLGGCYLGGVEKKIMTVSEEQYRQGGVATADQFPEDGLIPYKAFWARLKNWRNWQEDVYRAVHQIAFNGGTAGSRPIFPGAGYLEELGAKSE